MPLPKSRTVPDLLDEIADRFPDREALVGGGRRFTYAQLQDEVRTFAKGLHALGVSPGDKVAVLMGNRPEWIIADLAICSAWRDHGRGEHLGHQSRTQIHPSSLGCIDADRHRSFSQIRLFRDARRTGAARTDATFVAQYRAHRRTRLSRQHFVRRRRQTGARQNRRRFWRPRLKRSIRRTSLTSYTRRAPPRRQKAFSCNISLSLRTCGRLASECMLPNETVFGSRYRCSGGSAARMLCSIC